MPKLTTDSIALKSDESIAITEDGNKNIRFTGTIGFFANAHFNLIADPVYPVTTIYTSNTEWTKPSNLIGITVWVVAAGGGGGGVSLNSISTGTAGGGGGGATAFGSFLASDISNTVAAPITVGIGGTGAAVGAPNGGSGDDSVFGNTGSVGGSVTAGGGTGGDGTDTSSSAAFGTGGATSGGGTAIGLRGSSGTTGARSVGNSTFNLVGIANLVAGGHGGGSIFGGSVRNGNAGRGWGSGGGSGYSNSIGQAVGLAGANGVVILTEYFSVAP